MPAKSRKLLIYSVSFLILLIFNQYRYQTETGQNLITPLPSAKPVLGTNYAVETVLVTRVIDGDTIEINNSQKVRYIGINAPESTTKKDCFGKESYNMNKEFVLGKNVRLEKDVSEKDKYGRLLRYVYVITSDQPDLSEELTGTLSVNNQLVKLGFAQASTYQPDVKYQKLFLASQKYAKENKLGLWGNCY